TQISEKFGRPLPALCHRRSDVNEIVRDHTESYPALHSFVAFIEAATASVPPFENADAALTPGPPLLSLLEPALSLFAFTFGAFGRAAWDTYSRHTLFIGGCLVLSRVKCCIPGHQARSASQLLLMCFDSGDYQIRIAGALLIYLVIGNDLILGFLNLDHLAKLGWLAGFPLANDFGGRLEKAGQFLGDMRVAAEDPLFGLPDYLLDARHHDIQLFTQAFQSRFLQPICGSLHAFNNLAGEAFGLAHHPPHRAQEFLVSVLQSLLVRPALGAHDPPDFQNSQFDTSAPVA